MINLTVNLLVKKSGKKQKCEAAAITGTFKSTSHLKVYLSFEAA